MGLDNIPTIYPCRDVAIRVNDRIDCAATQEADLCPWKQDLAEIKGGVLGMLGTNCWYRGKAGEYMLAEMREAGYDCPLSFYGEEPEEFEDEGTDDDPAPNLDPDYCVALAEWMEMHAEQWSFLYASESNDELMQAVNQWRYAAKWLRWCAEKTNGCVTWY